MEQGEVFFHYGTQFGKLGIVVLIFHRHGGTPEYPGKGFPVDLQFFLGKGGMLAFQLSDFGNVHSESSLFVITKSIALFFTTVKP